MREKMYKFAPAILLSAGLFLLTITFFADRYYLGQQGYLWLPMAIIQTVISTICGILIKRLNREANTDALTGLHNRKYFYTKLSELKTKGPISLLLIDLDDFKSINDTYGHIVGDQVLQQFAEILRRNTRKDDVIARWGGEEFAVILPQTDTQEAIKVASRIRTAVENHLFSYENITCRITVSVGITSTREKADTGIEQFVKVADEALYRAKEKKNYIAIHIS
ncbi:GGDEF domain-containing protein [Thermincola potens]|uniref:Diguanylate cyclase n=1 Tax=Thermincola potens (strain JR) TaxID=635013 RepID=D5XAJ9_THEPJ|nr:GGDEF domain-containing protein [Thermincola potens]ADG81298.1 diguanylate cyclase [Thermincola potens JR]